MRSLSKSACGAFLLAALMTPALAAGDTEPGKTPAAPENTGADNQPNKPSAAISKGARVMSKGAKETKDEAPTDPDPHSTNGAQPTNK